MHNNKNLSSLKRFSSNIFLDVYRTSVYIELKLSGSEFLFQAGLSTFLVMFPVLFAPVGVYAIIAKAIVLVVIIGLIHGLILVPILLAALPNCLTGNAFCAERQQSMK